MLILDGWGNNGVSSTHSNGIVTINGVLSNSENIHNIPNNFSIDRIYPNPFNPITNITFSVPLNDENVKINVFDILGTLQNELINDSYEAGKYEVAWDATNKSSGIYFIELKTERFREIKKVTLLK